MYTLMTFVSVCHALCCEALVTAAFGLSGPKHVCLQCATLELRSAWASDGGWLPPKKSVPPWFYWVLPKKLTGELNPRWRAMAFAPPPAAAQDEEHIPLVNFARDAVPPEATALIEPRVSSANLRAHLIPIHVELGAH